MILSSLMPPTTRTFTPGFCFSNPLTVSLKTFSSRCVKPTQSVMSAGSSLAGLGGARRPPLLPAPPPAAGPPTGTDPERHDQRGRRGHRDPPHPHPPPR